jgi:hypothetical protein
MARKAKTCGLGRKLHTFEADDPEARDEAECGG